MTDLDGILAKYDALEARVLDLETKHDSLLTKLDADAGVTDTNYGALKGVVGNDPKTVANVTNTLPGQTKGFLVKIKDLTGKEYTIRPGTNQVVSGLSASMSAFVTKGYITVT